LPIRYRNHGGLTPTVPGHARVRAHVRFASSVARAPHDSRWAYAHRSLVQQHAFVHRESRFSTGKRTTNIRAAGVSPPWRSRIALAMALPQLLRRLPALHGRASLPMRFPNHGGLTPTAPVASVRPPAQWRLLRCTNAYTPRAAGLSPPWGDNAHATAFTSTPSAVSGTIPQARLHARPTTHGGLTPTALVSGEHAFVHRESRFSTGKRTTNVRAARVSPPWRSRIALAMAISEHNHGNTSRNEERRA